MRLTWLIGKLGLTVSPILRRTPRKDNVAGRLRLLFGGGFVCLPQTTHSSLLASGSIATLLKSLAHASPQLTRDALAHAVDRDFQEGRIVMVAGWTLAQTESQMLVLLSSHTPSN
jgi:hypothetical protein